MNTRPTPPAPSTDDALEQVFAATDRRPPPPAQDERDIRAAVTRTWQEVVQKRRTRRRRTLALAASVALAMIAAAWWLMPVVQQVPAVTVATVEMARGAVHIRDGGDLRILTAGDIVTGGRRLETGRDVWVALRWRSGASLRLREQTVVDIDSNGQATLIAGAVYVDTRAAMVAPTDAEPLVLHTRFGRVQHVGTQFMTEVEDNELRVRVREGVVQIVDEQTQVLVEAGERVDRNADGQISRHNQPPYGATWMWAEAVAPRVDFNGKPIAEFLGWIARETGRTVSYASAAARERASTTRFVGSIDPEPGIALAVLHTVTSLRASEVDGEIVVRIAADAP